MHPGDWGSSAYPEPSAEEVLHDPVYYTRRDRRPNQGIRGSHGPQRSDRGENTDQLDPITVSRVPIAIKWAIVHNFLRRTGFDEDQHGSSMEQAAGNLNCSATHLGVNNSWGMRERNFAKSQELCGWPVRHCNF